MKLPFVAMAMRQELFDSPRIDCSTDPIDAHVAAKLLGKRGGRPKGSLSSRLSVWLRSEIAQRQREGYRCRESFDILRDTENPDGEDAFTLTDYTSDQHAVDPDARVSWSYYKKLWRISRDTETGFCLLDAYHRL